MERDDTFVWSGEDTGWVWTRDSTTLEERNGETET